ncbi:XRE family transcriptional regulator [Nodosilinea sp. PGN35]|uniref:XRE family transcriptional regulator n=1 Tax=unclassified Nodosilinea TaxID=2628167 RepID=UPI000D125762|nr:S24 family peptidase [Nodosilinea sp. TSF1-S3]MDF0367493.1 helix-turn-helix domain-containing protein [Nodosilinea sp. TSF1-S3]PSN81309.1 transcriptional regulator [filamentous cyanobacterium CCP4]
MTNPLPDEAQADAKDVDQFPVRLKQAVGDKSVRGFARDCGFSDTVLRQYLNGQSEPTRPALLAIARTANISVEWLATGQSRTAPHDSPQVLAEKYIQKDPLAFETAWLRTEFPDSFEHLMLTQVADDSMEPTLPVGALVLVDTTDRDLEAVTHGIYLLKLDDRILVKRLQYVAEKTIRVLSDNAAYEAFSLVLPSQASGLSLMGRVIWVSHKLHLV